MQAALRRTPGEFTTRVASFIGRLDVRVLRAEDEKKAAFRLRYHAYRRASAIAPDFARSFADGFDEDENAWLFGLFVDDVLASSIRIHVASPSFARSPGLYAFRDVLMPEIEKGAVIVDPTRFVTDEEAGRRYPELSYAAVRLGFLACEQFQADLGLATVRPEHQAFYRRLFGLQLVCPPRTYPNLLKPLSLMAARFPEVREETLERFPFLAPAPGELSRLFGKPELPERRRRIHDPAVARPQTLAGPQRAEARPRPIRGQADKRKRRSKDGDS